MKRIGVIGAGTMGNGIAQVFATSGYDVRMIDVSAAALERGRKTIEGSLARVVKKGALTQEAADAALARVAVGTALKDAADSLDSLDHAIKLMREA